jgi:hypothetical protein
MPDMATSSGDGDRLRSVCDAQALVARAQRLVDAPARASGEPLAWHAEAMHVGDMTVIATIALRAGGSS